MKAPGTVASLGTMILISLLHPSPEMLLVFIVVVTIIGFWGCYRFLQTLLDSDPPHVVIDEVVGQSLACLLSLHSWKSLLASFILFRVLDIWKPLAIGWIDGWFKTQPSLYLKAFGVLADDLLAGACVVILIWGVYALDFFPGTW